MAEASQDNTTLDTRTRINLVRRIFQLIGDNSLDEIKQILESLPNGQCISILNSTIHGCTPLYLAVNFNNIEISRYLIKMSLLQGPLAMSESWKTHRHPLIAVLFADNPELIELVLQHLPNMNETISGPLTPLMLAVSLDNLFSVKLIVALGADVNRSCFLGRSPLMESTSNSEMCRFFISKDADVDGRDDEGFTALHLALFRQHKGSVIHLINAGADVRARNHEGLNPLIWATMNLKIEEVVYVNRYVLYSDLEKIKSLEILGACYACAQETSLEPWRQALQKRRKENLPKICLIPVREALHFSQEFTTERQLENLQDNPLRLAYQSILVTERILGRNNRLYLQLLLQTALIAKLKNEMEKVKLLIDYIQEYCQESSVSFVAAKSSYFKTLFSELGDNGDPNKFFENGGFAIFKMIAQAVGKIWDLLKDDISNNPFIVDSHYSDIVDTFLYMTSTTNTEKVSQQYLGLFNELVTEVVGMDLRVRLHRSMLHRAIKLMETKPWSTVELIRILLESGADPNSKDYFRRTPIMYTIKHVHQDTFNDVVALLLEYGSHTDYRDSEDFTAMDHTHWGGCMIAPVTPLSLQCLATGVILDNGITYEGILPTRIKDFINIHK